MNRPFTQAGASGPHRSLPRILPSRRLRLNYDLRNTPEFVPQPRFVRAADFTNFDLIEQRQDFAVRIDATERHMVHAKAVLRAWLLRMRPGYRTNSSHSQCDNTPIHPMFATLPVIKRVLWRRTVFRTHNRSALQLEAGGIQGRYQGSRRNSVVDKLGAVEIIVFSPAVRVQRGGYSKRLARRVRRGLVLTHR